MDDATAMREIERIKQLKARYFRCMDTKAWDEFRDVFDDELHFYRDGDPTPRSTDPVTTTADAFVERISTRLATAVTIHHGHMPEIELLDADSARGVWALFDWVDDEASGRAFHGYGHYHERYRKGGDGRWRIRELRLTRLRIVPLDPTRRQEVDDARRWWRGS